MLRGIDWNYVNPILETIPNKHRNEEHYISNKV